MRPGRKRRSGNQRPPSRRDKKKSQQKQPARTGALSRTGAWIAGVAAAVLATALSGRLIDRGKSFTANLTSGPANVVNPDPSREAAWDQRERDLAWELVVRGLERQPGILGDLRARTGTLLAAAGVVTSVVIGFFATASSSINPLSGILLLVGFLPAVLAVKECWLVLSPLHDHSDPDLDAYVELRKGGSGRAFEPQAAGQDKVSSGRKLMPRGRGILERRLVRSLSRRETPRNGDAQLTIGQLYEKAKKPYRWWRVTLNQDSLRELRNVANPLRTSDDLTEEVTSFLSLARRSNWTVIEELTKAFNKAAVLFGCQLVLWIVAAVAFYLRLHGAGTPHK